VVGVGGGRPNRRKGRLGSSPHLYGMHQTGSLGSQRQAQSLKEGKIRLPFYQLRGRIVPASTAGLHDPYFGDNLNAG